MSKRSSKFRIEKTKAKRMLISISELKNIKNSFLDDIKIVKMRKKDNNINAEMASLNTIK
jgi:hypothetical protein